MITLHDDDRHMVGPGAWQDLLQSFADEPDLTARHASSVTPP